MFIITKNAQTHRFKHQNNLEKKVKKLLNGNKQIHPFLDHSHGHIEIAKFLYHFLHLDQIFETQCPMVQIWLGIRLNPTDTIYHPHEATLLLVHSQFNWACRCRSSSFTRVCLKHHFHLSLSRCLFKICQGSTASSIFPKKCTLEYASVIYIPHLKMFYSNNRQQS